MANDIDNMNPVYDAMGNLVSGNGPEAFAIRNPNGDDSGRRPVECNDWRYSVKLRFNPTENSHNPPSEWYDQDLRSKYETYDPATGQWINLMQKDCQVLVDIYRCCATQGLPEEYVGTALVASSKQLTEWVPCDDGKGLQIRVRQFIFDDELIGFLPNTFRGDRSKLPNQDDAVWGNCDGRKGRSTYFDYMTNYVIPELQLNQFNDPPDRKKPISITKAIVTADGKRVNQSVNWTLYNTLVPRNVLFTGCDKLGPCETIKGDRVGTDQFCVTINSLERAASLDLNRLQSETPGIDTSAGQYNYGYGGVGVIKSAVGLLENAVNTVENAGIRYGEPVETAKGVVYYQDVPNNSCLEQGYQKYTVTQEKITTYPYFKICYRREPDGRITTQVQLVTDDGTSKGNVLFFTTTEILTSEVSKPFGPPRYKLDGPCCEDLLKNFNFDLQKPTPSDSEYYPKRLPYLKYFNPEWASKNPCDCEPEIEIADIWCYFEGKPTSDKPLIIKNINDKRTHTGKTRPSMSPDCQEGDVRVYHPFDKRRDIITGSFKHITKGLFNLSENLLCYLTSSTQPTESKVYYYDVKDCDNCDRDPYFAVSYGHINGSGSRKIDEYVFTKTPTDSIYSQYQLICADSPINSTGSLILPKFSFVSESVSIESDDIYVINFYREGMIERIDPGNFQINLSYLSGSFYVNNIHTGSNVKVGSDFVMSLIDDSDDYSESIVCDGGQMISYNIVSGSLDNGVYQNATVNTYGKVYPQIGIMVLHPKRLNELLGFNTVTGSNIAGDNAFKLLTSISGAASPTSGRTDSYYMRARNITYKKSTHYFVRVYPDQSNYSNNPTFVSGSTNTIFDDCFYDDPNVYITSVGLYDNDRNLIGIAKLSRPIKKNFDTDLVIKIRLNW